MKNVAAAASFCFRGCSFTKLNNRIVFNLFCFSLFQIWRSSYLHVLRPRSARHGRWLPALVFQHLIPECFDGGGLVRFRHNYHDSCDNHKQQQFIFLRISSTATKCHNILTLKLTTISTCRQLCKLTIFNYILWVIWFKFFLFHILFYLCFPQVLSASGGGQIIAVQNPALSLSGALNLRNNTSSSSSVVSTSLEVNSISSLLNLSRQQQNHAMPLVTSALNTPITSHPRPPCSEDPTLITLKQEPSSPPPISQSGRAGSWKIRFLWGA